MPNDCYYCQQFYNKPKVKLVKCKEMKLETENASCTILTIQMSHTCFSSFRCRGNPYAFEYVRLFIRAAAETDKEEMLRLLTLCGVSPPGNSTCWSQHSSQPRRGTGQKPSEVRLSKLMIMLVLFTNYLLLSFLYSAVTFLFIVFIYFWDF